MKRTPSSLPVGLFALGALLLTSMSTVRADEARVQPKPLPAAVHAQQRAAAAIGRDLLAVDEHVRRRAVQRLLARIDRGGEMRPFLEAMGRAAGDWANRRERLTEVWIEKALHGDALEREEASKLLHALGPKAVSRLIRELRHARGMSADAPIRETTPPPAHAIQMADEAEPAGSLAEPAPQDAPLPCCEPRIYDVLDLGKRGMNALQLRSLLQKVPDAIEVKDLGRGVYVVTATEQGHSAMQRWLDERRARPATHKGAKVDKADARRWRVTPAVYRVPRSALDMAGGSYGTAPKAGGLPRDLDPSRTVVHVGTGMDAAIWMRTLQRGPKGIRGERATGPAAVAAGSNGTWFSGRERTFRKGFVRAEDGAWRIEVGTLQLGIDLDVALVPEGDEVVAHVVAARTEVSEPMAVDTIPGPKGSPSGELDRPEWNRTRTRTSFRVPVTGGAALLSLGGLGSSEKEHILVVLHLEPMDPESAR